MQLLSQQLNIFMFPYTSYYSTIRGTLLCFYKTRPRNLPIDNPTLLSWNITDGDLNSKLNTLEYLNCITNIINSCGVYPQGLKDREIISTFHAEKVINDLLKTIIKFPFLQIQLIVS